MTVSYSLNVSKATFGGFARLLFRWKGSIFKSLWRESLIFCFLYVLINATYRHGLSHEQKATFAQVVIFAKYFMDVIPFFFILGFYVTTVSGRWMSQFIDLPWPDRVAHSVASFVHGSDERSRMIRRTLARYVVLLQVLTYQTVSTAVRKRFPTTQHLVAAGIMTAEERSVYEKVDFPFGKWWLPCHWFTSLATRAKKEGRIKDSILLKGLFEEVFNFRNQCAAMIGYDWIGIPLAYTQVATIATYLYALVLLVGTQSIDTPKRLGGFTADYYFPFVTVWRFVFSVGWLKVAEQLLNPYGEDDDDFELNWCLDRAVELVYKVVDTHHMMHPKVKKDAFWDVKEIQLPQTAHSAKYMKNPELGSAFKLEIEEADYLPINELCEKDDEENQYRNQSVKKKDADRQNSSFIRRYFNKGFSQSTRKKSEKNAASRSLSCKQGISNAAFSMRDEDEEIASTQSTPPTTRKSSQAKLVKKKSPVNKQNSVQFRPRSLVQKKQKTYCVEDAEMAEIANDKPAEDGPGISERVLQSPVVSHSTELVKRDESQDVFEDNPEENSLDVLMPSIPEEASRANSLASIEVTSAVLKGEVSSQQMNRAHDFANEVSEKLLIYRDSTSVNERWKENEGKDYESCCSVTNSEELSEDSLDENETNVAKQNEGAVSIKIEPEHEEKIVFESNASMEV